jgi:hypothetical protein
MERDNFFTDKRVPCVYRDYNICGENIFIFSSKLSLTKRNGWENLLIHQMNEMNIKNESHHDLVISSLEFILPAVVLISFVLLLLGIKKIKDIISEMVSGS